MFFQILIFYIFINLFFCKNNKIVISFKLDLLQVFRFIFINLNS